MAKGIVIETTGSWHQVLLENGQLVQTRLKGKFRLDKLKLTNPIAVGDQVTVGNTNDDGSIIIQSILPRKNKIIRQSPRKKRHYHIIASNIDQAIIVSSMKKPKTKPGFISRVLVALEYYKIKPIILFNKTDLYTKEDFAQLNQLTSDLEKIGYEVLSCSTKEKQNMELLKQKFNNKVSVLTGPSGVGKSSIVNTLNPDINLRTKEVSNYNEKGQHTTTYSKMHSLFENSYIIDTPGIKEYGLAKIDAYELSFYFPEMKRLLQDCKFNNCQHINEPKCAVKEALIKGEISEWRYNTYLQIREELRIENKHYL